MTYLYPSVLRMLQGKKEVVDLWKKHFELLLNCINGKNTNDLAYECNFDHRSE